MDDIEAQVQKEGALNVHKQELASCYVLCDAKHDVTIASKIYNGIPFVFVHDPFTSIHYFTFQWLSW